MPCSCRRAALPGCGGEWGPTRCECLTAVVQRTVDASNQKGSHGVLGRTSSCAQPRLTAAWHGLPCSGGDVRNKIEVSINHIAEQTHRVGLTRGFPPPRRWSAVSSSDCRCEAMQNRAAPLLSALILRLCPAAHAATTEPAAGIAAPQARRSAHNATSVQLSACMNTEAK
ncbi:hypothetical protein TcCL_NonESM08460 [Trypanosoma cruzi]|nr:hypothetical protein TcCL_NonESM08460 [Trypanosoma cruzi]